MFGPKSDNSKLARELAQEMKRQEKKPGSLFRPVTFLLIDLPRMILTLIGFAVVAAVVWIVMTTPP